MSITCVRAPSRTTSQARAPAASSSSGGGRRVASMVVASLTGAASVRPVYDSGVALRGRATNPPGPQGAARPGRASLLLLVARMSPRLSARRSLRRSLRRAPPMVFALVAGATLAACQRDTQAPPPGALTVRFSPLPAAVDQLVLATARMRIDRIGVFGDVPPRYPPIPAAVDLDALSAGAAFTFSNQPQGVYSRVAFAFENILVDGTWRGTPFEARAGMLRGSMVDLRSPAG